MVKVVIINPTIIPDYLLQKPAEELINFVSTHNDDFLLTKEITSNEDYVTLLDFPQVVVKDSKAIGDTITIYRNKENVYRMTYIELTRKDTEIPYNVIASIFHNRSEKIWGKALITKIKGNESIDCNTDEVIKILYRRAWHSGLLIKEDGSSETVEMDNAWNVFSKGTSVSLQNNKKFAVTSPDGQLQIKITSSEGTYLFAVLDEERKILIDI